jgi:orotidine-5'-phosphate decarboxylase
MENLYEGLEWEEVIFNLSLEFDTISVSLKYLFKNSSSTDKYFSLLPSFQKIPQKSLIRQEVSFEACFFKPDGQKEITFSKLCGEQGIDDGSDCLVPIPWTPSNGSIPAGHSLELTIYWKERGPGLPHYRDLSNVIWEIQHVLPMNSLFLPLKLTGRTSEHNNPLPLPKKIEWNLIFPENLVDIEILNLTYKPYGSPSIYPTDSNSYTFRVNPLDQSGVGCFQDHKLFLRASFPVTMDQLRKAREAVERLMRSLTIKVCVALVDLRGASAEAEKRRGLPDSDEYKAKYFRIAREFFPASSLNQEPVGLRLKKMDGDKLILLSPAEKSEELVKRVLEFLDKLSSEGVTFRAGIHLDEATKGDRITGTDSYGTEFSGPALDYATKVGDNKQNKAIRLTEPAVQRLRLLIGERFDIIDIRKMRKVPFPLCELAPKTEPLVSPMPSSTPSNFADRLRRQIFTKNTRVCVGLDPDPACFPKDLLESYGISGWPPEVVNEDLLERVSVCIEEFNRRVIDAVLDYSATVKPQSAHYERFGYRGIRALAETVQYAQKKGLMVILDAKRNDIGSTAQKYARAYLGGGRGEEFPAIPFDAITVNPYLGRDGINPFVEMCVRYGKGIFILVKTSNPSSGDLQDLRLKEGDIPLSQLVASLVASWSEPLKGTHGFSAIGAVVGATYPEDIKVLRELMPHSFFLMPGYGAQGGTAANLKYAFTSDGLGVLISSSRGVIYPCPPESPDFFAQVSEKARIMRDDLNMVISPP